MGRLLPRGVCIVVAGCLLSTGARASESDAAPVGQLLGDPAQLIGWLRERHPDFQAALARVEQAEQDIHQAGVLPNPEIDLNISDLAVGTTNPQGLSLAQTTAFTVGAQTMIELGKRGPRIDSAVLRRDAAREDSISLLAEKVQSAREAMLHVAYLKLRQAVLEENLAGARHVMELEKNRADRGDLSEIDFQRLALDTQSLEIEVQHNESDFRAALSACRVALASPCSDADVRATLLDTAAPLPATLPETGPSLSQRPDVQAVRMRRASADKDVVLADRHAIPDPTLGVSFTKDLLTIAGNQPTSFGITAGIPIPMFDHGQHDAARARARVTESNAQEKALLEQSTGDVDSLRSRKEWLERSVTTLEKEAVPRSETIRLATRKAFDLGDVNLTDLILAERTHRELLVRLLDMKSDLAITRIGLLSELGIDGEAVRKAIKEGSSR
jgi:cobalt-zinc-cadmium efflux system outer membrane protein